MNLLNMKFNEGLQAVLFDLDGTLIDSMSSNYLSWSMALKEHNLILNEQWFLENEGRNIRELIGELLDEHKVNRDIIDILILKKEKYFFDSYVFKPYEGVENLIIGLKKRGIKVGLVTAGQKKRIETTIPRSFLKNFDVIVTGEDTAKGKPSAEPYLCALKKINLKKKGILVVENAPLGIESAINAGLKCIGISSTLPTNALSRANIVINNFNELNKLILGD